MSDVTTEPAFFNVLDGEGRSVKSTPYGSVGTLVAERGVEVVWVNKDDEEIDPGWFSQEQLDVLYVARGQLRVEFADERWPPRVLGVGDLLVLPAGAQCRAYRWPRDSREPAVFLAVSPAPD